MSKLVQYVILNADILRTHNWPLGSVIAQCCHATTAVLRIYKDDDATVAYFNDIDHMHKVVLEVKDEGQLRALSDNLNTNDIKHKLWIEQPEYIATCIALKPYDRDIVKKFLKDLKLFKNK